MDEDNRLVVRRFWEEVFEGGDLDAADELFAAGHVIHDPVLSPEARGAEGVKEIVAVFRGVSPGIRVSVEDELADGDRVVTRWTAHGILDERMRGVNLARESITVSGISIFRVTEGRLQETWQHLETVKDVAGVLGSVSERVAATAGTSGESSQFLCKVCPWLC